MIEYKVKPRAIELLTNIRQTIMEDMARHNINKLNDRYPDGFDRERSLHRGVENQWNCQD